LANEDFYIILGAIGLIPLIIGGALTFSEPSSSTPPPMKAVGGFVLFVGIITYLIIGVRAAFDIKSKIRGWNIDRKSDDLYLREKERELKRREEKYQKEKQQRAETRQESRSNSVEPDTRPTQPHQPHKKQPVPETEKINTESPFQDAKTFEEIFGDEPILKTGGRVSSKLKKEQKIETPEIIESGEKESSEEEYIRSIMIDSHLRYLLLLYDTPEGYIVNQSEVIRREEGKSKGEDVSGRKRQEMNSKMKDLKHAKLVEISIVKEDITGKKTNKYEITKLGREYLDKLWDEKIKTWTDFMEKYGKELYGKK
jgi:hypothetical protein